MARKTYAYSFSYLGEEISCGMIEAYNITEAKSIAASLKRHTPEVIRRPLNKVKTAVALYTVELQITKTFTL